MRGGAHGDFILTMPAIDSLRSRAGGGDLCLAGYPAIARLARPDHLLDLNGASAACLFRGDGPPSTPVREQFADARVVLAYTTDVEGELQRRLQDLAEAEVWVHDPRPPPGWQLHMVEHLLGPLRARGIPVDVPLPHVQVRDSARKYAAGVQVGGPGHAPLVLLHPGSGGQRKCWPAERFAQLANQLGHRGCRVALVLGPVEAERGTDLTDQLEAECETLVPPDLPSLAGLLAAARLFIGNDSGPGHLAAAVGTATLSLFGPTDPALWRPRSAAGRVLVAPGGDLEALAVDSVRCAAEEELGNQEG